MFLMRSGTVRIRTKTGDVTGHPGQWVLPTTGPRQQDFSDNAKILSIHYRMQWPEGNALFKPETAEVFEADRIPELERETLRLLRQVDRQEAAMAPIRTQPSQALVPHLRVQLGFARWLTVCAKALFKVGLSPIPLQQEDPRLLQAQSILDQYSFDQRPDLEQLAREVRLSVSQLNRMFVQRFRVTPRQYLDRRRMETVAYLLHHSNTPVKQIAYQHGFKSPAHFTRWFRAKTNLSPSEYRTRGQGNASSKNMA